ncbi:unnamed protein product [Gongylonema pulchrum]|uniref:Reverse transcriptase domain-containing protein n=1 Tax=Gongylonema pulchrum TaxID=637853 RepID=A0A183EDL0_9BILA|nr:unnamed protein product [Gongylonema pulchrum]
MSKLHQYGNYGLPFVPDSWHTLKVRMQQKVEAEGVMASGGDELGFEDIGKVVHFCTRNYMGAIQRTVENNMMSSSTVHAVDLVYVDDAVIGETLINKLQERARKLRELYHTSRNHQANLDRHWRKTLEKKSIVYRCSF